MNGLCKCRLRNLRIRRCLNAHTGVMNRKLCAMRTLTVVVRALKIGCGRRNLNNADEKANEKTKAAVDEPAAECGQLAHW